jgi:enoyl-CoA hydratase
MTDESEVLFERRGAVGLITLNRPKALNALTHGMCLAMKAQLDAWAVASAIKTVVVRGAGERAISAHSTIPAAPVRPTRSISIATNMCSTRRSSTSRSLMSR